MKVLTQRVVVGAAVCLASMAVLASSAMAKTTTLHFFEKSVSFTVTDANGNPAPQNQQPTAGERFTTTNNEYPGNHKHHAKRPTATTHISCVIGSGGTALCNAQFAMGSSMLLADFFTINLNSNGANNVAITGGTGKFQHAHGKVVTTPVGNSSSSNNSDTTVTYTT